MAKDYEKLYNETLIELMNLKARVGSAIKTTKTDPDTNVGIKT